MPIYAVACLTHAPFTGRTPEVLTCEFFRERHREKQAAEAEAARRLVKSKDLPPNVSFAVLELPELSEAGERDRRGAMAEFTAHFGAVPSEFRHAIVGVLLKKGRPMRGSQKSWDSRRWTAFRRIVTEHVEACRYEDCAVLAAAREMTR